MFPGIEGRHAWIPPGEDDPVIVLNKPVNDAGNADVWPCFKVRRVTGLYSLGDPQDVRDNRVGADGEIPRMSRRRGKTVVYEGTIKARTRLELLTARDTLIAAFNDMTGEGTMVGSWHPLNTEFDGEDPRYFKARALTCEVIDEQTTTKHERPFVLSLRMSDAKFYMLDDDSPDGP